MLMIIARCTICAVFFSPVIYDAMPAHYTPFMLMPPCFIRAMASPLIATFAFSTLLMIISLRDAARHAAAFITPVDAGAAAI